MSTEEVKHVAFDKEPTVSSNTLGLPPVLASQGSRERPKSPPPPVPEGGDAAAVIHPEELSAVLAANAADFRSHHVTP